MVRRTDELAPFLRWFPYSEYPIDLTALDDAKVTATTEGDPYAPARRQTKYLETIGQFRGLLPSIELKGARLVHDRVTEHQLEVEIVVADSVTEQIQTGEFATLFYEKIQTGRLTVLAVDAELPFYLGLGDDGTVQIGVEDDEGLPRALVETRAAPLKEWAEEIYTDYRDRASILPAERFESE